MKSTYIVLGVIGMLLLGVSQHAHADTAVTYETVPLFGTSGDFIVGPGKVEYTILPGTTRQSELIITNRLGDAATFSLAVEDVSGSQDPNQSVVLLGNDRGPYSLKDYVTFPTDRIELQHGQRARIPVTITVPIDAEPGGHYGSVLVSVVSDTTVLADGPDTAAPRSVVVSRVGALYFVTVPGDVTMAGGLKEFAPIQDNWVLTSGPIDFEILFANTGSVHLNPYGSLNVTNMFDETIEVIELDPWYAMPDSLRYFEASLDRQWLFGMYTATLELKRGYEDLTDQATVTFVVIPKLFMWTLGSVTALFIGLLWYRRRARAVI